MKNKFKIMIGLFSLALFIAAYIGYILSYRAGYSVGERNGLNSGFRIDSIKMNELSKKVNDYQKVQDSIIERYKNSTCYENK